MSRTHRLFTATSASVPLAVGHSLCQFGGEEGTSKNQTGINLDQRCPSVHFFAGADDIIDPSDTDNGQPSGGRASDIVNDFDTPLAQRSTAEASRLVHSVEITRPGQGGIGGDDAIEPKLRDRFEHRIDLDKAQIWSDL
jgi:hypothetical protein